MTEYVKKYYTDGNIRYEGEAVWSDTINDFIPNGYGKMYYGNGMIWQDGLFIASRIIDGKEYTEDGLLYYKGTFTDFEKGKIDYGYSYFSEGKIFNEEGTAIYKGKFEVRKIEGNRCPQVFIKDTGKLVPRTRIYYINWSEKTVKADLALVKPTMIGLCGVDGSGFKADKEWTEWEPYLGRSDVIALLFQQRYGGQIIRGKYKDTYRYWNRIDNFGKPSDFDITGYVYDKSVKLTDIRVCDRKELLMDATVRVKYINIRNQLNGVIDIKYKDAYPADVLSNLYPNSFIIDGVRCVSMESFLQSLKFRSEKKQIEICAKQGKDAIKAAKRKRMWKHTGNVYWKGKKMNRTGKCFEWLIDHAYDELFKNPIFFTALRRSKGKTLIHTVGTADRKKTLLTKWEFLDELKRLSARF